MKSCTKCNTEKELSEFRNRKASRDGKESACKTCRQKMDNEAYNMNETRRNSVRNSAKAAWLRNRFFIKEYLDSHPCIDCGLDDPELLEFDHVRGIKSAGVGALVRKGASIETIVGEINKCEVRCLHCHRKKTIKQFGWYACLV